jgi:hypothetical protein
MIESEDPDVSIGQGTKKVGVPVQLLIKLSIWVLELVVEALGTCLILFAMAVVEFRYEHPPLNNDLSLSKVFGIVVFIMFEFAMTGYLATTLISRFALRGNMQRFYPPVCAGLYLLHSSIFFIAAGNSLFRRSDLIIQLGGACLTLACTWGGNRLIANWDESGHI